MKTWPKIKLVDDRGRTVTVFKRVPKVQPPTESTPGAVHAVEILDFPQGIKPPIPSRDAAHPYHLDLVQELTDFVADFTARHGRWPGTAAEQVRDDAAAVASVVERWADKHDLYLWAPGERVELARRLAGKDGTSYIISPDAWLMAAAGGDRTLTPVATHFVGEGGTGEWVADPKPPSKKAAAHMDAELARDGWRCPHPNEGYKAKFDGQNLPAWDDVQVVLEWVGENAQAGETLTLTVSQLQHLVGQRC